MSSRSASALLDAALAVPFDPEQEDRRQLSLAAQEQWPQGPVEPSVVDIAPEVQQLPPPPMQIAPDPLIAQADAAMEQGMEPPLPTRDGAAEEDLPPVVQPGAGSGEQGVRRQGGGRRSASALLADVADAPAAAPAPVRSADQALPEQVRPRRSAAALLAEIPEESSMLRRAADVPVFIAQGITTGLKGLTDAFGADNAASQALAANQEFYQAQLSPEAQASQQRVAQIQQAAQDQGLGAQVAAAGRAFAESPTAFVAQGVGTMAPTIVMGAAGKAVGLGARGVQAVQAATGATMGGGIVKGEIYQAVEQAMLQAGRSPQEAAAAAAEAQAYGGENIDQILAGYGLGFVASAMGAERLAGRAIAGAAAPTGGVLRVAGRTALQEALPEAAQGGQEQLARNLAQQREGFEVPTMRGVAGAGALEGLAGLAIGGPAGVASSVGSRAGAAPSGVQAPWQAAREQAVPTVTRVEVVDEGTFGEPTTAAVERPVATGDERFAPPAGAVDNAPTPPQNIVSNEGAIPAGDPQQSVLRDDAKTFFDAAAEIDSGTSAQGSGEAPRVVQTKSLEVWAGQRGRLIPTQQVESLPLVSNSTSEHEVRIREADGRMVKVTWPGVFGQIPVVKNGKLDRDNATPSQYLQRHALQNQVFNTQTAFEGVTNLQRPSMVLFEEGNQPSFVVSQPFLQPTDAVTETDIRQFLEAEGFAPVKNSYFGYYRPSDRIAIVDAKPDNFVKTAQGIVPFDVQMAQFTEQQVKDAGLDKIQAPTTAMEPEAGQEPVVVQTPQTLFSKRRAEEMFERAWNANLKGWYDDNDPNDPHTWREWLQKSTPYEVALVLDSDSEIYQRFLTNLGDDVTAQDVVEAYQKGTLPDTLASQQAAAAPIEMRDVPFQPVGGLGEPVRTQVPAPRLKKLWQTAGQRVTKKSGPAVMLARKEILLAHHNQNVAEAVGLSPKEVNAALRKWSNYPASAKNLQDRLNSGVPEVSQWTGISNSAFIVRADVKPEDVNAFVKSVEASDTPSWQTPDGKSLRTYIAQVLLAIDTRILYKDLSFVVDSTLKPLGLYQGSQRTISIRANSPHTVAHEIGHYLDHKWGLESGVDTLLSDSTLNLQMMAERTSPERAQWTERFKQFVMDVSERADIRTGYLQSRREVFARFVDAFVRWTAKEAGVRVWGEDRYSDRFTGQDFTRFVKLLQEKAFVDAKDGNPFGVKPEQSAPEAAKTRIKNMTAQSGAIDLSIVEDLVEYGRTIYRAGMDYATWAAAMTREFGQAVAQFLRQAFDRIVAAYQASRFSDTTGAVGDVRPKAKPRQFEAKARQNEALAPETRARLGSEYIPISLNAQAEAAKEWINTNGLEAAKLRIAQLSGNDTVPTPVDFAIGIEAAGRLSATGDHAGAAGIVSTMSQRATSLGQTISVLAMMARLTPEGIVLYGQNIVSRYINTLPQEAQDRIKALQAEVDRLRTALAEMKFKEGSEVIRSGKLGDEKIQDRIKRRVKARVQADLGPAAAGPEVTAETKARTQGLNRQVRDVLLSDAKQSEMVKQITQILTSEGNMPAAEAEAVGKSIVAAFTKIVTETRRNYVQGAKQGGGARKAKADALLKMLTTQREMTDAEFVAEVSQLMGLPGMTPALARELRQLGQRYENATDPDVKLVLAATMFERAHEVVPADFWVKVRGFAYLSMLFAPKTWIRNVIGNQIQWIFNVGRDAVVSGIMDPAMSLLTGQRTTAGLKLGARLKGLLAPIEDVRRGYLANKQFAPEANFVRNFMAGVNHLRMLSKLTTQNKFEIADVRNVGARIFSSKLMRAWEGTLSIALGAGDRAFWMSQFRTSLAQIQAAAEKNGEWTGQPTPEMIEAAMAEAAYAIYQNPNIVSANANKIRGALNRLSTFGKTDQYGLGTGLMAFTQVPGSITLRGLVEWSPLGMIPALYRGMRGILYASSTGRIGAKFDQAAFNKEFTQALLGTGALYAAGYYLYALGIVTASREDDEDLEAMRRASGKGAYRINLTALRRALLSGNWFTRQEGEQGDVIVPYDWAQPVAITFAAGAELAAQVERSGREQLKKGLAEKAGMAAMSLAAGAKSLEELPLLSGLSSFIKTWGYAGPLEATTATVAGMPSQFVPQLVRQAGQINDNLVRETRGGDSVIQREFMKVLASVPGYSTKFPVRFDITGQAIQRYQYGGNSVMNVFFSPAMASEVKRNPVLQEVSRLVDTTGETSMVPRQVKRSAKINGVDVDLTNDQLAAYSYYLGNFTMSHFAWRMAAPVYARLPDEMKVKMLAQDITDIDAAVKSAVLGHDPRRLTRNQMFLRQALVNSPLGQSVPPR